MSSFRDFLASGRLGRITLGLSQVDVVAVLGQPLDVSLRKKPEIWSYGSLQVVWSRERGEPVLSAIYLYFARGPFFLPDSLGLEGWVPSRDTTVEEFQSSLSEWGLTAVVDRRLTDEQQLAWRVHEVALVIFDTTVTPMTLDTIQVTASDARK